MLIRGCTLLLQVFKLNMSLNLKGYTQQYTFIYIHSTWDNLSLSFVSGCSFNQATFSDYLTAHL